MGVSCWENESQNESQKKFSVMLSLTGDAPPELVAFRAALTEFDDAVSAHVASRSRDLLKKDFELDTVRQLHSPLCRPSEKYGPSMKVALPMRSDGSASYQCYNASKRTGGVPELVDIDDLEVRGGRVRVIMSLGSMWIAGTNSFGVSARALQVSVQPVAKMTACAFADLGDGDDEDM
jgi:hypothetical protein